MATGLDVIIAHARGSVWNTPVAVNAANRGLLLTQWPLGNGLGDLLYDNSLSGTGFQSNAIRGLAKLTGDGPGMLRYTGLEHAVAMAMGTAGAPTVVDTTGQQHVFQLASNLDGLFDTIAVLKAPGLPIWEYASVKYAGFTVTMTADGLAEITFNLVASSCRPISGQTNTTLAAVTYRSKVLNVFGTHIKWRANIATGAALSDSDRFYPSRIVLTYNRNMDGDFVMDGTGIQTEPSYTDVPVVTLDADFPIYGAGTLQANNTFLTNALAETPMKMDITMTSPQLAGSTTAPYSILIEAPNCVIGRVDSPVGGPGKIPQTLQMALVESPAARTGMTGLTRPFRWTQVSQLATDALLNP